MSDPYTLDLDSLSDSPSSTRWRHGGDDLGLMAVTNRLNEQAATIADFEDETARLRRENTNNQRMQEATIDDQRDWLQERENQIEAAEALLTKRDASIEELTRKGSEARTAFLSFGRHEEDCPSERFPASKNHKCWCGFGVAADNWVHEDIFGPSLEERDE